jgi:hypothetical protein
MPRSSTNCNVVPLRAVWMTELNGLGTHEDTSSDNEVLDSFKPDVESADESGVHDGIGTRQRLTWNSVTDTGGSRPDVDPGRDDRSSFRFDLGGALARLAGDDVASSPDQPDLRSTDGEPTGDHQAEPEPEPLTGRSAPITQPAPFESAPVALAVSDDRDPVAPEVPAARHDVVPAARPDVPAPAPDVFPAARPDVPAPAPDVFPAARPDVPAPAPDVFPAARPDVPAAVPNVFDEAQPLVAAAAPPAPSPAPDGLPPNQPAARTESVTTEYPRRVPGTHLESQLRSEPAAVPSIQESTPVDEPLRPHQRQSVFDDTIRSREPSLPPSGTSGSPTLPSAASAPTLPSGPSGPSAPSSGAALALSNVPAGGALPTLPASNPAAPPPVVESVSSAPSTNDITALRSAQLRASKQQRQGKLFARSLLAFVLLGGVLGAALVFGRSLLFTTEWDAALTPIVNQVELARGQEFDETVPLTVVPAAEFGDRLQAMTIGDQWADLVPQWRALGLSVGEVTTETVGAALAESTSAMYDPSTDTIYQMEGVDPIVAAPDLRVALEAAFDHQIGAVRSGPTESDDGVAAPGFTGVSSLESIATRAVDALLVSGRVDERRPANEALPIPIAYELAAVDVLGEPILAATGVDPAVMTIGSAYPLGLGDVLSDAPATTTSGLLQPGELSLAEPRALGTDDWSLVWGTRLPQSTVDRLVELVVADSYRPVDRGGVVCVVGVFQTQDEPTGTAVLAAMSTWAANSPVGSQALATSLGPNRVQIEACDPGVDGGLAANPGVVDALLDRQQNRLTN